MDILTRIYHIRASITSIFGSILKMDSTKKITKKLAGHGRGTAQWMTSIGNEVGQILISVLTVAERPGLNAMVSGVMEWYRKTDVPPPVLLYVDCDCCKSEGSTKLQTRFAAWPDLHIRLDIWHFMRRLAVGCTTDARTLYPATLAQWPDCCCLMEAIFTRLCGIYRSPRKMGMSTVSRWDLILGDYRRIRQRILANGIIMQQTNLQLVDVSQTTLVQWHNQRVKSQDNTTVMQGLTLLSHNPAVHHPLNCATVPPVSAPTSTQLFVYPPARVMDTCIYV
ncbi:uncharacterized protein LOC142971800 [Anarhichas minor]|uniref:uncharacterized protein LOC142971800 n=1 Tax=Anarhichas minor TaxID=65739 RepID=UPI003F73D46E